MANKKSIKYKTKANANYLGHKVQNHSATIKHFVFQDMRLQLVCCPFVFLSLEIIRRLKKGDVLHMNSLMLLLCVFFAYGFDFTSKTLLHVGSLYEKIYLTIYCCHTRTLLGKF